MSLFVRKEPKGVNVISDKMASKFLSRGEKRPKILGSGTNILLTKKNSHIRMKRKGGEKAMSPSRTSFKTEQKQSLLFGVEQPSDEMLQLLFMGGKHSLPYS